MPINEKQFVRECVNALGYAIESLEPRGKQLGFDTVAQRRIWKQILEKVASGGGKYKSSK